jgi:hypothetical protein
LPFQDSPPPGQFSCSCLCFNASLIVSDQAGPDLPDAGEDDAALGALFGFTAATAGLPVVLVTGLAAGLLVATAAAAFAGAFFTGAFFTDAFFTGTALTGACFAEAADFFNAVLASVFLADDGDAALTFCFAPELRVFFAFVMVPRV